MVQGMTGFGSAERGGFRVEVRSLNHRFMDVIMRMPPVLSRHEMPLREILRKKFERGKFDVYVSAAGAGEFKLKPNIELAREVVDALSSLKMGLSVSGEVDMDMLLHWKDTFIEEEVAYDEKALIGAFEDAVAGLEEMRLREGEAITAEIDGRARALEELNGRIMSLAPGAMKAAKEKFFERLRDLLSDRDCDDTKLMQEAASMAEKADITEEFTRLKNHTEHMRQILKDGGTVGRKLDFLLQELNREANTIASKTDDYGISSIVIEMKTEIEKAREQAQNIQ